MKHLSKIALLMILLLAGCHAPSEVSRISAQSQDASLPVSPDKLTDDNYWSYYNGVSADVSYTGYIKFSIELDEQGRFQSLIFHPNTFAYHADYLATLPTYAGLSRSQIDALSLHDQGRRLILGTALSVTSENYPADEWDVQIVSEDPVTPEAVARILAAVIPEIPHASPSKVSYLPAPAQVSYVARESAAFAAASVKIANRQPISDRVCYAGGWTAGYVRKLNDAELKKALAEGSLLSDAILVLESVPAELPEVAGIIVAAPSSPSSHPALLSQMLGIPFFFEKDAMTRETWTRYAQSREPVFIRAQMNQGFPCDVLIRDGQSLASEDVTTLRQLKKPLPLHLDPYDDQEGIAPVTLDKYGMNDGPRIGAKAANVAELRRIIPDNTVEAGLGLPISAYKNFVNTAQTSDGKPLKPAYDALLGDLKKPGTSLADTIGLLSQLRTLIEKSKLEAQSSRVILEEIEKSFAKGTRIKLRSSSNMEDLPEFNGAGLYESKGACVGDDSLPAGAPGICEAKPDEVIKALKKVWASLFTMKAWVARRTFAVNEDNVGMGVLIQASYKGELANGVALAQYPSDAYFDGERLPDVEVVSTGFPGEDDSVTNPPPGKIPETIRLKKDYEGKFYSEMVVSSSEIPRGQKLLSEEANASLYALSEKIYRHYERVRKPSDPRSYVLDLEWKLIAAPEGERVIVKQVRPVPSPLQSTQGLGFGSFVVGEKKALLCPTVQEFADGLSRMRMNFPIEISAGLLEVPLNATNEVTNPLKSLSVLGQALELREKAELRATAWEPTWGSSLESRQLTVVTPIALDGQTFQLSWKLSQSRSQAEPKKMVDNVQSLWSLDFTLTQGEHFANYVLVLGQDSCDAEAYQGLPPGSYGSSMSWAAGRKPPYDFKESFASVKSSSLVVEVEARSSFQGFDKTRFLTVDRVKVSGLIGRDLIVPRGASVYAPGHHNFQWTYVFDVTKAEGLSPSESADLQAKGIRYLMIEHIEIFQEMPVWSEPGVQGEGALEAPIENFVQPEETYKVYTVSEQGARQEIDEVRRTSRESPSPF